MKGKGKQRETRDHLSAQKVIEIPADREVQVFRAPTEMRDLTACEFICFV